MLTHLRSRIYAHASTLTHLRYEEYPSNEVHDEKRERKLRTHGGANAPVHVRLHAYVDSHAGPHAGAHVGPNVCQNVCPNVCPNVSTYLPIYADALVEHRTDGAANWQNGSGEIYRLEGPTKER
ncbi:hypothetical protein POVWA1_018660 [Plasmodium ovale wallikeri]|uniref:Uncharacterized protein n=1 Tax=Plasmodium ovale wallikeri TaxID=864142 RepID=A0A1A8YQL2_PLAOA|nr:hypothetical protein POVWA1_018660 [Plasmodium ovale wallikeri]